MGRFARYEFIQKIAIGGMAEVWSAWGVGADGSMTEVVVKRILPQFAADESFQNMLLEEAEVTAHLRHGNIVGVLDWGHLDETCFLAMERVVGLDGRQLLDACAMRKITIPPAVALHAIGEIFKGLDYAHTRTDPRGRPLAIVHRDVSPSNVLLSVTGEVKLADFGIARAKSRASHTVAGQVRGKPRYMSPEQAKGEELDGRSDLFAAGLVLHEFLTGQPVFPPSTYLEEVVAIIQKGVPRPSQVNPALPPELDALVLRLCERDLGKRFKSGAAACEAIMEWAARRKMQLDGGGVAELVTSIVRPTQQKKPAEVKGETRIVRVEDVDGVAHFTSDETRVDADLLSPNRAGRAPAPAPKASPSGARSAARPPDRRAEPALPVTGILQMPPSSGAVPPPDVEDEGTTDRRPGPGTRESVVGAIGDPRSDTAKQQRRTRAGGATGVTGVSAAVAIAIAVAIWWVWPRALVQTDALLDESPVPTLALVDDASIAPAPTPVETRAATAPANTPAVVLATPARRPRASPAPTAAPTAARTAAPVIATGPGFLTLRAKPNGEVTIDGEWAGSTPLSKHELPSGVHKVVVNTDDGRQASQDVTITPGDVTTVTLTLK